MTQESGTAVRWALLSRLGAVALASVPGWASYSAPASYFTSFCYDVLAPTFNESLIRYGGAALSTVLPIALGIVVVFGIGWRAGIALTGATFLLAGAGILFPQRDVCTGQSLESGLSWVAL